MKQINSNTLCYRCLGCNKLELEEFNGTNYCKNSILVDKNNKDITTEKNQSTPVMSKKVQQAILDIKENLGIIKTTKGEQIKL